MSFDEKDRDHALSTNPPILSIIEKSPSDFFLNDVFYDKIDTVMKMKTRNLLFTAALLTGTVLYAASGEAVILLKGRRKIRKKENGLTKRPLTDDEQSWIDSLQFEEHTITSFDGLTLKGKLLKADTDSNQLVICIHGYHSYGLREYAHYLRFYHEKGYHIFLPDNRAHGDSEGKYVGWGWLDHYDIMRWIAYLIGCFNQDISIALHGISMGASTALMVSGEQLPQNVKCIISDCAFSSAYNEFKEALKKDHIPSWILPGADLIAKKQIGFSYHDADALKQVKKSQTPTLFIHGDTDALVPVYMTYELYNACHAEKDLLIVENAGHGESFFTAPDLYKRRVSAFLKQYMQ